MNLFALECWLVKVIVTSDELLKKLVMNRFFEHHSGFLNFTSDSAGIAL